jgi:lysophospholipase L1-like esterase
LGLAIDLAGGDPSKVLVLSIPDWGVTPFARDRDRDQIRLEIDQFNAINLDETRAAGAYYLDITPNSRQAANDPALLAPDELHPSAKMYAAWVELMLPQAKVILR